MSSCLSGVVIDEKREGEREDRFLRVEAEMIERGQMVTKGSDNKQSREDRSSEDPCSDQLSNERDTC